MKQYKIHYKPKALKDLKKINKNDCENILNRIKELENNMKGDVKKLASLYEIDLIQGEDVFKLVKIILDTYN